MKRILKLFSVLALASSSTFATSCEKNNTNTEKSINIKARYSNYWDYKWGNDEFDLNITKNDINSIKYSTEARYENLEINFNQEIDKKPNYNLKFMSKGIYYILEKIKIDILIGYENHRDDFLNYSHKLYLIFEFDFEGKNTQIDFTDIKSLFPSNNGRNEEYTNFQIQAAQI